MNCHLTVRLCFRKRYTAEEGYSFERFKWQGEDPLQVKITIQEEFTPSKRTLQRRNIHLKSRTLKREGPLLEKSPHKEASNQKQAIHSRGVTLHTEDPFLGKSTPQEEVSRGRKASQQRRVTLLKGKTWLQED